MFFVRMPYLFFSLEVVCYNIGRLMLFSTVGNFGCQLMCAVLVTVMRKAAYPIELKSTYDFERPWPGH